MAQQAPPLMDRWKARLEDLRARHPLLDHLVATVEHYVEVQGSLLAGAVTYYGFLSFFPVLALGFALVGYVAIAYPDARDSLVTAIEQLLPGIVTPEGGPGTISLSQIEDAKATAGILGFLGVLYSGLGWLYGLRTALQDTFKIPRYRQGSFLVGKLTDLMALGVLGVVLIVSVGISGAVKGLAGITLEWLGLASSPVGRPLIWTVGSLLALAASTLLFLVMYKLLGKPMLPMQALVQGALIAALGFELLKLLVVNVLGGVGGTAFAPLAIAITLVIWISYFSRLVILGASWAITSPLRTDNPTRRTDLSEAAVAVADRADAAARLPVPAQAAIPRTADARRLDPRSAVLGAVAGAVVAAIFGRSW